MQMDINAGVPEQSRWVLKAHQVDPIVTRMAFWAQNGSFQGMHQEWGESGGDKWHFGKSMAVFAAAFCVGSMYELDIDTPTDHFVRINKPPQGEAPEEVRQEVEGVELFIRSGLQTEPDIIRVHPPDLILALLSTGRIESAMWYRNYMNERLLEGTEVLHWDFDEDDMHVYSPDPRPRVSYEWYLKPSNLNFLTEYEPRFGDLIPDSVLRPPYTYSTRQKPNEVELAHELAVGLENGQRRADIIQRFVTIKALEYFAAAQDALTADMLDTSNGVSIRHDMTTGEVTRYRLHGVVLLDRDAGIDRTKDRDYEHIKIQALSPEQIAQRLADTERRKKSPAPTLPALTDESFEFHLTRHLLGV